MNFNKKEARKRAFNSFRYYPIWQKLYQTNLPSGETFEDFETVRRFPSNKRSLKAFEAVTLESRHIKADYKINSRFTNKLTNGDRLLYINENNKKAIGKQDILRISSFSDPDNRKEYLEIYAATGVFSGPAPVQPDTDTAVIVKALVASDSDLDDFISKYKNSIYKHGNADSIPLNSYGNFYCRNLKEVVVFPVIFSFFSFNEIKASDVLSDTEYDFEFYIKNDDLYVWKADNIQVEAAGERLLKLFYDV